MTGRLIVVLVLIVPAHAPAGRLVTSAGHVTTRSAPAWEDGPRSTAAGGPGKGGGGGEAGLHARRVVRVSRAASPRAHPRTALRKVDRYGVTKRGEQYTGWKQLPAGSNGHSRFASAEDAARFLAEHAVVELDGGPQHVFGPTGMGYAVLIDNPAERDKAYRLAALRLHPDRGGSVDDFQRLQDALRLLAGAR